MNEMQTLLADTVTRLFTDRVTTELLESAEKGQWPADALAGRSRRTASRSPRSPRPGAAAGAPGRTRTSSCCGGGPLRACRCPSPRPWSAAGSSPRAGSTCRSGRSPWRRCTRRRRSTLERDGAGWQLERHGDPRALGRAAPSTSSSWPRRGTMVALVPAARRQRRGRRQPGARAARHAHVERGAASLAAAPAGAACPPSALRRAAPWCARRRWRAASSTSSPRSCGT